MEAGEVILVRVYPDKEEERVILRVEPTYVLACHPEAYSLAASQGGLPEAAMGFPIEDVIEVRGQFVLRETG